MNETLFAFCANIFGFISGGISLFGLVVAVCNPHLPSNKIQTLDNLLNDTEDTLKKAVEDGLLVPEFAGWTEEQLNVLKEETCTFRARAYSATTWTQDYAEFLRGTSRAIGRICQSVKKLRAEVITSSQQRRRGLMHISSEQTQPLTAPHSNPHATALRHPEPTPPAIMPRPHSCPPALSAQKPDHVGNVPTDVGGSIGRAKINHPDGSSSPSDPFADSRSDLDVGTVGVQHRASTLHTSDHLEPEVLKHEASSCGYTR